MTTIKAVEMLGGINGDSGESKGSERLNPRIASKRSKHWIPMMMLALGGISSLRAATAVEAHDADNSAEDKNGKSLKESAVKEDKSGQSPLRRTFLFHIERGTLGTVIPQIAKETGIHIDLSKAALQDIKSNGVQGVFTLEGALGVALDKTGVSAHIESASLVTLDLSSGSETVTVAATVEPLSIKYTAQLLDLPQTLTVIPQDVLQTTAASSLVEALRAVPGITFGAGEGGNPIGDRPFVRGMDTQSSTYIDGMRDIGSQSREVFDVDSIEVAEGPGGAYGGRGTSGGSININSKMARQQQSINGSFTPGTADYKRGTVDINQPLTHSIAGRLNGLWHKSDVAGRDGANNDRWGVASSLAFGLGTPTRAYLDYYHLVSNAIPDTGVPYNNPTFVARKDGAVRILQTGDGSPVKLPHRDSFYGLLDRDKDRQTAKQATARVEHDLFGGSSVVRNTFRYGRTGQDYIYTQPDDSKGNIYYGYVWRRPNSRVSSVYSAIDQTDISGSFFTKKIKHSYATGMEFGQERGNNDAYTIGTGTNTACASGIGAASAYNCTSLYAPTMHDPWAGSIALNHNPTRSKSVTKSVYAFDTMSLSARLLASFGIRYDNYSAHFKSALTSGVRSSYSREDNLVNYNAGIVFKPIADISLYSNVSTSAQPTGNALAQGSDSASLSTAVNANLEPMKTREEEVGVKWRLAHGRGLLKADGFRADIDNVRITQADGTVAMAGKNRTYGAEVSFSGNITRKWEMFGGYTYLDAVLVHAGGSGTANGLADGSAFPNTPKHSTSITSNYQLLPKLRIGGGIYSMTKVWGSQVNNKWIPGYVRYDLFGDYKINKHINLQVNVLNVSDKLYYDKAYPTHYASMAPGRSGQAGLNFHF